MLHMQNQLVPFGEFTDVDLSCTTIDELNISYQAPSFLRFRVEAPNHTTPLARYTFIRFWDDAGTTPDDEGQSEDNPLFEGWIEDITPDSSPIGVIYTAYDASRLTSKKATVMSGPWQEGDVSEGESPEKGIGVVPRLVVNVKNDADDDYSFSRNNDGTIGEIIAGILEDQYHPLYWINAAPGDGSDAGNGVPYIWDGELEALETKPQEKLVFESDTVRNAINQCLVRFYPEWRFMFRPGSRKWRFGNVTMSPAMTITLNDPSATIKVISGQIQPTIEGRFSAVEIRGPETSLADVFTWVNGGTSNTLQPYGPAEVLETVGLVDIVAYSSFQIVDATKRRGTKLLPEPYLLGIDAFNFVAYRGPVLQISFDEGSSWVSTNSWFDFQTGRAWWDQAIYIWHDHPNEAGAHYSPPNAVRLLWAYYIDPLIVRKPDTGFEGTIFTEGGLQAEYCLYDEALSVGKEYGIPVTTSVRRAQFEKLAQSILDERKDIAWVGSLVLNGLLYDFAWLDKRINITSKNADGELITTGWESINAWLTDVSYDFENGLTTISLNSDQMANIGMDEEGLKRRLKIVSLQQVVNYETSISYRPSTGMFGGSWDEISGAQITTRFDYVDPETGEIG